MPKIDKELKRLKKYHDSMEGYITTIGLLCDTVSSNSDNVTQVNTLIHKNLLEAVKFIGKVCRTYSASGTNVVKCAVSNGKGYDTTKDFITVEKVAAKDYALDLYSFMIDTVKARCANEKYQIDAALMENILTGNASEADYAYLKASEPQRVIIKYSEEERGYVLEAAESM